MLMIRRRLQSMPMCRSIHSAERGFPIGIDIVLAGILRRRAVGRLEHRDRIDMLAPGASRSRRT